MGKLSREYHIELEPGAKSCAPHPKGERADGNYQTEPSEWCAGMVVVPKASGKVVDLTKSVQRERHVLPSVEETLAQLGGAKIFSKLDANSATSPPMPLHDMLLGLPIPWHSV